MPPRRKAPQRAELRGGAVLLVLDKPFETGFLFALRKDGKANPLAAVVDSKIEVLVDSFSLKERGIQDSERLEA